MTRDRRRHAIPTRHSGCRAAHRKGNGWNPRAGNCSARPSPRRRSCSCSALRRSWALVRTTSTHRAPVTGDATNADINDVYVFQGRNEHRTAIAVTAHPAASAIAPLEYATDVAYKIKVDDDGDAKADMQYVVRFGAPRESGRQPGPRWCSAKAITCVASHTV